MDSMEADNIVAIEESFELAEHSIWPVLIALIVGFILMAVFLILRKRSTSRRDFLLMGLSESGKTSIFMRLLYDKFAQTYVSVKENIGEYKIGSFVGRIVDIPGHYKVRDKFFDQYKDSAKGIIFVIDSVSIQKDVRDVADALFTLLCDTTTLPCSFLILCNKQDRATAKSVQIIKNLLEKELNLVRDTRGRKLQSIGEDAKKVLYLGKLGKDFEWSHLQQNIQFYECSAKNGDLMHLTDWLERKL